MTEETKSNFIRDIVANDNASGKYGGRVVTRFPPEPNGYLHVGHAKAICLDFGIAAENNGVCHLRFDDTNPSAEDVEYVDSIMEDVRWLGFDWGRNLFYASDYFGQMYEFARELIRKDKAYICTLDTEGFKEYRGVPTRPGKESPSRNRPIEESLDLFERMKNGEFDDGQYVLRAKIDMSSPNLHMRDPVIYRIKKESHHRTNDEWCIYPMYDFAHCLEDSVEGITHSLCTLEFEVHRPLYDWILDELGIHHPQQIEFARLNMTYTIMSKRKLLELVEGGYVNGWNDPRMPTISGMRQRGYTPEAIRAFMDHIGITKVNSLTDSALLEHFIREDLNIRSSRVMGVLDPLKVIIDNYPEDGSEELDAVNNPEDTSAGMRKVPFSRELYIEKEDFMEDPPGKFFRLAPGREVRLRYAYFVTCQSVVKNDDGSVVEVHCTYDPATRGGDAPDGRKVKGTLHWVSARHAVQAEVRLYDRLFVKEDPADESDGTDFKDHLNPESLVTVNAFVEPSLQDTEKGSRYQFERLGYFCVDSVESGLVFNRTLPLRDKWAKIKSKG